MIAEKKVIVFIDDDPMTRELVKSVLEEKNFEVRSFPNFDEALKYLEHHTPELIISDLIGHDDYNGIEFYLKHIMQNKIQFALWSGSVDFSINKGVKNFSLLLEGMPMDYRVTYNPTESLSQDQVNLIIEDFKNNEKTLFPAFRKPCDLDNILQYFNLKKSFVLYLGLMSQTPNLSKLL